MNAPRILPWKTNGWFNHSSRLGIFQLKRIVIPRFRDGNIVNPPSIQPSAYLTCYLLNHWVEFNQTCYMTSPHDKGVWEQYYFSFCPMWSSDGVRRSLFICHAVFLKTTGQNLTKLATWHPLVIMICQGNIIFPSIRHATCISNISTDRRDFVMTCYRLAV